MYKLTSEDNLNLIEPIKTVFKNRNVDEQDINFFIKPYQYEWHPKQITNMEKGVQILLKHIEQDSDIHVQIDKDLDGFTSAAILINYLRKVFPNIKLTWSNHTPDKKHGIDVNLIPESTKLFIVPDAGSNEYEIHKELAEKGIEVLILDHHEAPHYSQHATVINVQLDSSPNKWLSGAGVVYKFVKLMDYVLGINHAQEYVDLVAFGMIGDSMEISSKETKWLIAVGLDHIKNEFIQEIVKENIDSDTMLTPGKVAFKCNPKINAYLRLGTKEELDDLFKAFIGHQEITINNRLRKADKSETWARRITRICNNMYNNQRKLRDKIVEELSEKIEAEKLYENSFIVVELQEDFRLTMSGYIASFLVDKYKKPTLVLRKNESGSDLLVGSMRGYDGLMDKTKDFLLGLNLFEQVEGHQNAAGIKILRENTKLLDDAINQALKEIEQNRMRYVDLILPAKMLTPRFIEELDKYSHVWGKGLEEPAFAVEGIEVNLSLLLVMGKNEDTLKFNKNDVEFVKFGDINQIVTMEKSNKSAVLNVVGRTEINRWNGNATPQFVIEDYEIVEVKERPKFVF